MQLCQRLPERRKLLTINSGGDCDGDGDDADGSDWQSGHRLSQLLASQLMQVALN